MSSTRLPGKVLKKVDGLPLLLHQVRRVTKAKMVDKILIATSISAQDDKIEELCKKNKIEYFRGPENDVLSRYYECAKKFSAEIIIRLTADCPLLDPVIIDNTIRLYLENKADYAANTAPPQTRKFPDGMDVEVFSMAALSRAHEQARDPLDREHVTFYFWKYNNGFKTVQLDNARDYSKYRFTVDYPEDFEVVKFIMQTLKAAGRFGNLDEIINILDANPRIRELNSKFDFGIGWKK